MGSFKQGELEMTPEELEQHFYELPRQVREMTREEFDRRVQEMRSLQGRRWRALEQFLQGYTDQEIAEQMRIKVSAVRSNLRNAHDVLGLKERGIRSYDLRMDLKALFWHFRQEMLLLLPGETNNANDELTSSIVSAPPTPENTSMEEISQDLEKLDFIGRDRDLTNLANLKQKYKIVLIKAGSGIGKSTLARKFLQTHFTKVIRIEMGLESGNVTPAEEKVSQILRKEFGEEPSRDFGINLDTFREKLVDPANPIGVLIDDLESALDEHYRFREKLRGYDDLLVVLGDPYVRSFTLITSRRSLITPRVRVYESFLEGLDITAWQQYFYDCDNAVNSDALNQMRDAYNGNAKVMDLLHSAIQNRFKGNIEAYWNRYKEALLADPALETLISVEMNWLRDNQPDAYNLLCRMGCYRYQDIKTVPWEGLICLLWDVPEDRQHSVIENLIKTSLVEFKYEYFLHPAVRALAKSSLHKNRIDWETAHRKAGEYWDRTVTDYISLQSCLNVFEAFYHYYTIEDFTQAFQVLRKKINDNVYPRNRYAYLRYRGYSSYLIDCFKKVEDHLDNIGKIHTLGSIGVCYYCNNEYKLAIESLEKCEHLIESETDYKAKRLHSECLKFLADCNYWIGNSQKAIEYCYAALEATRKIDQSKESDADDSESSYPDRIQSNIYLSLAFIQYGLGEYEESLLRCEDAMGWANISDEQKLYREMGDALAVKSLNLYSQNKINDAVNCMSKSIDHFSKIEDSLSEGHARCYLARFYLEVDLKKSEEQISIIQEIYNKGCKAPLLRSDLYMSQAMYEFKIYQRDGEKQLFDTVINYFHQCITTLSEIGVKPDLAEVYFKLALTYQAIGEHDQAKEYKEKALELFEQMEAPKQIERVNNAF